MENIFVIKEAKTDFPVASAWDEGTAKDVCKKLNEKSKTLTKYNYTGVPLFFELGTQVNIIAPPISKEYLPSENESVRD